MQIKNLKEEMDQVHFKAKQSIQYQKSKQLAEESQKAQENSQQVADEAKKTLEKIDQLVADIQSSIEI